MLCHMQSEAISALKLPITLATFVSHAMMLYVNVLLEVSSGVVQVWTQVTLQLCSKVEPHVPR